MYGSVPGQASFANNCLLARRLVEKGVRFIQLYDNRWDTHGVGAGNGVGEGMRRSCGAIDKPMTALIRDLKQRGLLERSEEHTSELQSLMRISYAVFCWKK